LAAKAKAAEKKRKAFSKSKKKRKTAFASLREDLKDALDKCIRPLKPELVGALGWPATERVCHDSNDETVPLSNLPGLASQQLTQVQGGGQGVLGFPVVHLLLKLVDRLLKQALKAGGGAGGGNPAFLAAVRAKQGGGQGGQGAGSSNSEERAFLLGMRGSELAGRSSCAAGLDSEGAMGLLLALGTFTALHRLVGRLELALLDDLDDQDEAYARRTCGGVGDDDEGHELSWPCLHLVLSILETICNADALTETPAGRSNLRLALNCMAGDPTETETAETAGGGGGGGSAGCAFSAVFSRVEGFLPMLKSLPNCVPVLRTLEAITKAARKVDASRTADEGPAWPELARGLSRTARKLLTRPDLGAQGDEAALRLPAKVLGYTVQVHLEYAPRKLDALEAWAADVLPLLANGDDGQYGDEDSSGELAFPTLTKANLAHYLGPLLAGLVATFKASKLEARFGRDPRALLLQVHFRSRGIGEVKRCCSCAPMT